MSRRLQIVRRPAAASIDDMTPGDLLYRLSLVSPQDYKDIIALARAVYKKRWPFQTDVLLLRTGTGRE